MSDLRARISAAAQELFLREGIEGVSMRKIADIVGVSAPAIYRHYENKDDLLNEIIIEGLRILEGYLRPALEAATPEERLTRLINAYLEFALEQPKYFDFAFLVPSRQISGLTDELTRHDWVIFQRAVEQISECMATGVFKDDNPMEIAILVWAEVHGLVTIYRMARFGGGEDLFREIYRRSVNRLLDGLRP